MDQAKIGKFISERRKKQGFLQKDIATKLGISEKTVSKWECGNGLPEVAYMEWNPLNAYDIENAGNLYFYFLAVCNFYAQYYESLSKNRYIYLEQARMASRLLVWFEKHLDELNERLRLITKKYLKL